MTKRKTLAEIVASPGMQAKVDKARARLDAEDAGWVVWSPRVARAMLDAIVAARRGHALRGYKAKGCDICTALDRLDRVRR